MTGGLTSGDPLGGSDPPRHESGLPGLPPEPERERREDPPDPTPERPEVPPGYSEPVTRERPREDVPPGYWDPTAREDIPPGYRDAPSPAPIAGRYVLSGWWRRVGAAIVDSIIVFAGAALITAGFAGVFSIGFFAGDVAGVLSIIAGLLLAFLAIAIVAIFYAPVMMARTNGQTIGRMAVGIRVIRTNEAPMTFAWAMLREVVVKWIVFGFASSVTFGLAHLLDYLWPLWDEENRALHDFLVSTRVVRA